MGLTSKQNWTVPDLADPSNIPADLELLAETIENQVVMRFASTAARDAAIVSPAEGMVCVTTDTTTMWLYNGSAWRVLDEPPQAWTPTVTQSAGVTVTVTRAWSMRSLGGWRAVAQLEITSSGTASNAIVLSTPYTMESLYDIAGFVSGVDTGTANYHAVARPLSTTTCRFGIDQGSNFLGVNPAWQLVSGDSLHVSLWGTY